MKQIRGEAKKRKKIVSFDVYFDLKRENELNLWIENFPVFWKFSSWARFTHFFSTVAWKTSRQRSELGVLVRTEVARESSTFWEMLDNLEKSEERQKRDARMTFDTGRSSLLFLFFKDNKTNCAFLMAGENGLRSCFCIWHLEQQVLDPINPLEPAGSLIVVLISQSLPLTTTSTQITSAVRHSQAKILWKRLTFNSWSWVDFSRQINYFQAQGNFVVIFLLFASFFS